MNVIVAPFLLALGLLAAWSLLASGRLPHVTSLLGGHLDGGEAGIRLVRAQWLLVLLALLVVALGALLEGPLMQWFCFTVG